MAPWGYSQLVSLLLPRPSFASSCMLNSVCLTHIGAEMADFLFLEESRPTPLPQEMSCEASAKSLPWNDLMYTNITGKKKTYNSSFPVMLRAFVLSSFTAGVPFWLTMDNNTKVTFWNQHGNRLPLNSQWPAKNTRYWLKKQIV